jgi:hypothetical protein
MLARRFSAGILANDQRPTTNDGPVVVAQLRVNTLESKASDQLLG